MGRIIRIFTNLLPVLLCISFIDLGLSSPASQHIHLHKQGERVEDGAFGLHKDGDHSEFDHEVILGSVKDAEEFDHLEPEEAKRRLAILLKQMDLDKNGFISRNELHAWILRSFRMLSEEESEERFDDADENEDGKVTWEEYVADSYGMKNFEVGSDSDGDDDNSDGDGDDDNNDGKDNTLIDNTLGIDVKADGSKLMRFDQEMFEAADLDHDGSLDRKEFMIYNHPEEHPSMVKIILKQILNDKDTNKNGHIDFQEFVGDRERGHDKEWLIIEKERFDREFDKDGDGSLNSNEILSWVIPNNSEIADEEVSHLFAASDDNHDDLLSFSEIIDHHDVFVGSEATDFGDHLQNIHSLKDEL